jgi:DNA-binding XRE family transcriptional regulator
MARPTLKQRLYAAGVDRQRAEEQRTVTARSLHRLVHQAAKANISKAEIARVAGISRQTVHEILRD